MNRRHLLFALLGLPLAKPAIAAVMAPGLPTFNDFVLANPFAGAALATEKTGYSIPCFINEEDFGPLEIKVTRESLQNYRLYPQQLTYQFKE